jgi:NAD(P)-dependent dehydrogenase (short-subunit alcohol dehydrogenase family)
VFFSVKAGCHIDRLVLFTVNMASYESIRQFAATFARAEPHVDILVNNAGIMLYPKFQLTEDGHELVWQTNYLGEKMEGI